MVCLSGLEVLDVFFSGESCKEVEEAVFRDGEGDATSSACDPVSPTAAFWDEGVRECADLRLSTSGLASSVYVTAGIVPFPIQPCSSCRSAPTSCDPDDNLFMLLSDWAGRSWDVSWRERRRASRRSIRSLHCSSSCRMLSTRAFSVSERGVKFGRTLLAL